MKKQGKTFELHRETLKRLTDANLEEANGGLLTTNYISCIPKHTCPG